MKLFISIDVFLPKDNGGRVATYNYFKKIADEHTYYASFYDKFKKEELIYFSEKLTNDFGLKKDKAYFIPYHIRIRKNLKMLMRTFFYVCILRYPYLIAKFYSIKLITIIKHIIHTQNIKVVYIDHLNLTYLAPIIKSIDSEVKIINISHNNEAEIVHNYYKNQNNIVLKLIGYLEFLLICKFEKKITKYLDKIFCISMIDAKNMSKKYKSDQYVYYPMPYYHDRKLNFKKVNGKIIGICGSLSWPPNIDGIKWYLKNIHPILLNKFSDYQFNIAGSGANNGFINELKGIKGVLYMGPIPSLSKFYDECLLIVVPLLSGSGIRIKLLDSFSFSKPVVATEKAVQGLNLINGKHLFYSNRIGEIVHYIEKIFDNTALQQELVKNAYEYLTDVHR